MPEDGDRDGHSRAHDQPGLSVDARKDKDRGEDDHQEGDGAQVGLFEDEERGEAHEQKRNREVPQAVTLEILLFGKKSGQRQDQGDLAQLRRLEGDEPQLDPALGA